jgi:hypothetical protein
MRNAIFSGLTPLEMENSSQYWKNDPEEGGKKLKQSFDRSIKTIGINLKEDYFKITSLWWEKINESFKALKDNDLVTIVYNFCDNMQN